MGVENNIALVRRTIEEAYNHGNVDVYDQTLTENYVAHAPGRGDKINGRDGAKHRVLALRRAAPDLRVTIDKLVADDDHVVTQWRLKGTHDGPFNDLAPTNRPVTLAGATIDRFVNGQVAESWHYWDTAHLDTQLGTA
ncbi:ester cyclase [Streptosporangium sp. NPDC051023]|uniref:ester cyclase n=1 Tax=Streptosporangium sp. NPDC051023 TaxID=3155410 RepID=UPI003450A763